MAASMASKPVFRLVLFDYLRRHSSANMRLTVRCYSAGITGNPNVDKTLNTMTAGRAEGWLRAYENYVGLSEVRDAQSKVIEAESAFLTTQNERRKMQQHMLSIQSQLKRLAGDLEKTKRGDDKYLELVTEENVIIKRENSLRLELENIEEVERGTFAALSSAVRESHEKERTRTERTKYWSIIGSIIGAAIGIIGTSLNNYLRMRELRGIVRESADSGVEMKGLITQMSDTMKNQHNHIQNFVSDLKRLMGSAPAQSTKDLQPIKTQLATDPTSEHLEAQTKEILSIVKKQEDSLGTEMQNIKKLLAASRRPSGGDEGVIYVGPELEDMLEKTEKKIEWKIKMNALWTVTVVYGAFALTLPILYNIFKGGP